jgi:hypothetical protein
MYYKGEIFKPITDFEEYEVSNNGRIKSLARCIAFNHALTRSVHYRKTPERIKKQINSAQGGCSMIQLNKNGVKYHFFVGKLVAAAFLKNPNNYKFINYKDGNKQNSHCNNLEWVETDPYFHGKSKSIEYRCFRGMWARCNNENDQSFKHYGGRGITVCPEWVSFEQFYKDMGDRPSKDHSLDRIDVDGNYEPGNCRWATRIEQCCNKRNNIIYNLGDRKITRSECARELGVDEQALAGWERRGKSKDWIYNHFKSGRYKKYEIRNQYSKPK